jgi:hypothetical protein
MWAWSSLTAAGVCGGVVVLGFVYRSRRKSHYRALARRRQKLIAGKSPRLKIVDPAPLLASSFAAARVVRVADFLEPESLAVLRDEALAAAGGKVRSYVPAHKKGGTVSYEQIHNSCPACLAFYHCEPVGRFVSQIVGEKVGPAGDHDQSAESILYYDESGDHIQWHFDHNFYEGRQFTALINLVNRSAGGGLSASRFVYRDERGGDIEIDTSENSFVIFEGQKVLHRATPTESGDLRIMLSMTFNTRPTIRPFRELKRRIKDTAFFGPKVLWK